MRIMIVDDERMICEWLQFCIQINPGCELCGCAHNGEQALTLFKEVCPDVVFTDIKMPVMDGLELLEQVKRLKPETLVVLLTAFSEFDLARKALRSGADEYLLKTEMNNQMFREVLGRLEERIEESKQKSRVMDLELSSSGQQHSIVRDILRTGRELTDVDVQRLKECSIRWRDGSLFAISVWKRELLEDFKLPNHEMVHHVVGFAYDDMTYVVVGNLARDLSDMQRQQVVFEYASAISSGNQCTAGLSAISEQLLYVNEIIAQSVHALSTGYYEPQVRVLETGISGKRVLELQKQWSMHLKRCNQELYSKESFEFCQELEQVLLYANENQISPLMELIHFCHAAMEMAYVRYMREDADLMKYILTEEQKCVHQTVSFEEMKKHVMEYIRESVFGKELDVRRLSKGVAVAVEFIRKHYSEPISLWQVASQIPLNTEYLSRIFKEEVGCNYTSFLSETRLKKAAYLLSHTSERVQKIAEQVGYPNVSYFSTTFKKRYGLNPYEYRRGE